MVRTVLRVGNETSFPVSRAAQANDRARNGSRECYRQDNANLERSVRIGHSVLITRRWLLSQRGGGVTSDVESGSD